MHPLTSKAATRRQGMGGVAADALELYDPGSRGPEVRGGRWHAYLMTGGGAWFFNATYNGDDAVDLSGLVRRDTVYRGRYAMKGDEATLRVSVMNAERPAEAAGNPDDSGSRCGGRPHESAANLKGARHGRAVMKSL
jgi:hypothetical protein